MYQSITTKQEKMKNLIIIMLMSLLSVSVFANNGLSNDIESMYKILESKKVSQLVKFFNNDVELAILDDDYYGKVEAVEAMNNFFSNRTIELFEIIHNGGDETESYFIIGKIVVSGEIYRMHLLIKSENSQDQIVEMTIDEE